MFANSLWVVFFQKMKYNDRINESLTEVYIMSNKIVEELVAEIRQDLAILYKAAEAVALLDMLVAFAHTSSTQDYSIFFFFSFHSKLFLFSFFFLPQRGQSSLKRCASDRAGTQSRRSFRWRSLFPMTLFATSAAASRSSQGQTW